jgi:hypothetical protein
VIRERTSAGQAAARAEGRVGGRRRLGEPVNGVIEHIGGALGEMMPAPIAELANLFPSPQLVVPQPIAPARGARLCSRRAGCVSLMLPPWRNISYRTGC